MTPQQLPDSVFLIKTLAQNSEYYSNVFKKTERLLSVLFYILSYIEEGPRSKVHVEALTARGMSLYETSLQSLTVSESAAPAKLVTLQLSLVGLEGALRLATGARVITEDLLGVMLGESDLITRFLRNHYLEKAKSFEGLGAPHGETLGGAKRAPTPRIQTTPNLNTATRISNRVSIPKGDISSDAHLVYSQLTDRGERIKTVLKAKPAATIKDISEVITDVSEKTIQRELNSLIEKGQVIRQGERRWSTYSAK